MSSPRSMSRPCSLSHQPQWWSLQTRLPGGCHPPQWPPGGSWNVTNVICENIVMKVTALPDNGPSSSWETSSIFSRMMEPWIFGTCYHFEIFSFTENQWLFRESQHFKESYITSIEVLRLIIKGRQHLSTGRTGPWKLIFTELSSFVILMLARKSSATWLVRKTQHWPLIGHYYLPAADHDHVEEKQLLRGEVLGREVKLVTVPGKVEKCPRQIFS